MKVIRFLSVAFCLFLVQVTAIAQVVVEGIRYNIIGDNTVEVAGPSESNNCPEEIVIPSSITVNGKEYMVEAIGKEAFYNQKMLKEINLPSTIRIIRVGAFSKSGLNKIKLPVGLEEIERRGFSECKSLKYVYFPPSLVALGDYCFQNCSNFINQEGYHGGIVRGGILLFYESPVQKQIWSNDYEQTFSYKYAHKIYNTMQEWQKKKSFESADQWRTRVTTQTRERKMRQFVNQFKQEFASQKGETVHPTFSLGVYDNDYNVYSLNSNYGVVYVSVPESEKEYFVRNFKSDYVVPTYCVNNDKLAISSVAVNFKKKTYTSPTAVSDGADNDLMTMELPPLDFSLKDDIASAPVVRVASYDTSLEDNIPVSDMKSANTFVIAIGNENYQLVPSVAFAENDINTFSMYCQKTLGIPMQNIRKYKDATFGVMLSALKDVKDIADAYNGELNVIFYYAGHGIPGEADRGAYLLPADADGKQQEICFPVARLYKELGNLNAKSVVVFMDACFSGAQRGEGMLASARGVAVKAKEEKVYGNMVVFSAATGEETAYPYKDKGHGMFTYFLLKKLQESGGNCTLGELSQYITANVKRQSVVVNRKSQTPTVAVSSILVDSWKSLKLK